MGLIHWKTEYADDEVELARRHARDRRVTIRPRCVRVISAAAARADVFTDALIRVRDALDQGVAAHLRSNVKEFSAATGGPAFTDEVENL